MPHPAELTQDFPALEAGGRPDSLESRECLRNKSGGETSHSAATSSNPADTYYNPQKAPGALANTLSEGLTPLGRVFIYDCAVKPGLTLTLVHPSVLT